MPLVHELLNDPAGLIFSSSERRITMARRKDVQGLEGRNFTP